MIIVLSGTHSTGKTTLLSDLKKSPIFSEGQFHSGPTRTVRKLLELEINDTASNYDAVQLACVAYDLATLEKIEKSPFKNHILDRGLLDTLVYSEYLRNQNKLSDDVLSAIKSLWRKHKGEYNLHFFTSIFDSKLTDDGERSTDEKFQNDINTRFDDKRSEFKVDSHFLVYGDRKQRVHQISELVTYIQEKVNSKTQK